MKTGRSIPRVSNLRKAKRMVCLRQPRCSKAGSTNGPSSWFVHPLPAHPCTTHSFLNRTCFLPPLGRFPRNGPLPETPSSVLRLPGMYTPHHSSSRASLVCQPGDNYDLRRAISSERCQSHSAPLTALHHPSLSLYVAHSSEENINR